MGPWGVVLTRGDADPSRPLARSGDRFGHHSWEGVVVGHNWHLEPPTTASCLAQDVYSVEAGRVLP